MLLGTERVFVAPEGSCVVIHTDEEHASSWNIYPTCSGRYPFLESDIYSMNTGNNL
jgi:hypothetical protein